VNQKYHDFCGEYRHTQTPTLCVWFTEMFLPTQTVTWSVGVNTTMTTAKRKTPQWYIESEEVDDSYKPTFEQMLEAFNDGKAVTLNVSGTREAYLYRTEDGRYRYCHHTEGRWRIHEFVTFEDSPSLQILVMVAESISVVDVEETKLYHAVYGLKEPDKTFVGG